MDELGGHELVRQFWDEAIHQDSQIHARDLILPHGLDGMKRYWAHTLDHEAAGFAITHQDDAIRIDMHDCPSKGFLIRNGLAQYGDYCDHCMGWIGPMMREAGFVVDHEHNHLGKCWWEMRARNIPTPASLPGTLSGEQDVRLDQGWACGTKDMYFRATDADEKKTVHDEVPPESLTTPKI